MRHITSTETYIFSVDKADARRSQNLKARREAQERFQQLLDIFDIAGTLQETKGEFQAQPETSFILTISKKAKRHEYLDALRSGIESLIFERFKQHSYIIQDSALEYSLCSQIRPLYGSPYTEQTRATRDRLISAEQFKREAPEDWTYLPHLQKYLLLDFGGY